MSFKSNYTPRDGESYREYLGFIVTMPVGLELAGVGIAMDVKQMGVSRPVASFTVGDGIEILDDLRFKFSSPCLKIPAGEYVFDILMSYPDGEVSYISGTWVINETVSRKK